MPDTYTVKERTKAEVWGEGGQYGAKQAWNLVLVKEGQEYQAQANTKLGNEFPGMGETVEGDIVTANGRQNFKRAKPAGGSNFQRDPKERESIIRQHSQQMAITWAAILDKKGQLPEVLDYVWLKGVIDIFDRDAKGEAL